MQFQNRAANGILKIQIKLIQKEFNQISIQRCSPNIFSKDILWVLIQCLHIVVLFQHKMKFSVSCSKCFYIKRLLYLFGVFWIMYDDVLCLFCARRGDGTNCMNLEFKNRNFFEILGNHKVGAAWENCKFQ